MTKFTKTFLTSAAVLSVLLAAGCGSADNGSDTSSDDTADSGTEQTVTGESHTGATVITESTAVTGDSYTSTSADENALAVSGSVTVNLDGITVTKSGDADGGDDSNFYGTNSAVIAKDGANVTITNATITTDADGANGVFSYGGSATTNNASSDGTTLTISDSTITTTGNNAGGTMTTGGGTSNVNHCTITTSGTSSAAIRSDRGGGTVNVSGGTYTTNGLGSPAVYSTADITISDATLAANASEGLIIEGANSITLDGCTVTDNNTGLNGQSTTYKNIFLYQSMSGDARTSGNCTFTATDTSFTTEHGDDIYVTNTTAVINLSGCSFTNNDADGYFLRAQADSWGNSGSNGGQVTLNFDGQSAAGNIYIDSVSTLAFNLTNGSSFTGAINSANTAASVSLSLDTSSTLTLTGDTWLTALDDADSSLSNIDFNGYTLYVNGSAIN